jgi:hypothetical protein
MMVAQAGPRDSVSASGWGRTSIAAVGKFTRPAKLQPVAVAAASTSEPPTPASIEELILASNGW